MSTSTSGPGASAGAISTLAELVPCRSREAVGRSDLHPGHDATTLLSMTTVVVPFAGTEGKTRLDASRSARRDLSLAMLADVLAAAIVVGGTLVVTGDAEARALAADAGAGDGRRPGRRARRGGSRRARARRRAARRSSSTPTCRASCPPTCARSLAATPARGLALVEALDGTTNALGLSAPEIFAPLYGPDSASALPRALEPARDRLRRRAEPRRRRRHARRSRAPAAPLRPAHAGRASPALAGTRAVKVVVLSGGVGGARFVQGVVGRRRPAT